MFLLIIAIILWMSAVSNLFYGFNYPNIDPTLGYPYIKAGFISLVIGFVCFFFYRKNKLKAKEAEEAKARRSQEISDRIEAQKKARRDYLNHFDVVYTRVAGVTFKNDDKSSRQAILKAIRQDPDADNGYVKLKKYESDGETAIHVYYEDKCVGNIPRDDLQDVLEVFDRIQTIEIDVEDFITDDGEKIYRADLTILARKMI